MTLALIHARRFGTRFVHTVSTNRTYAFTGMRAGCRCMTLTLIHARRFGTRVIRAPATRRAHAFASMFCAVSLTLVATSRIRAIFVRAKLTYATLA